MPRDEKLDHLRRVPLFARMNEQQLLRIGELADEVEVGLEQVLTEQGHLGHEFFIVMDGHVSVYHGKRQIAQLHRGDFFGEIALLEARPRTATVRAEGITRLLVIGHREFHALMDEFPAIRIAVLDAVAERLRQAEGQPAG